MRRALALISLLALAGAGRAVRVPHPESPRVRVPAGKLQMGVPLPDLDALLSECRLAVGAPIDSGLDQCRAWVAALERRPAPFEVWIDSFWIDRNEVTGAEYRRCARTGACDVGPLITGDVRHIADNLPMVNVTRAEAGQFCSWRGGRLPTEAEWERAARGDDSRTWPWGDIQRPDDFNHGRVRTAVLANLEQVTAQPPVRANGDPDDADGWMFAAPPGSLRWSDSPYGIHDMAGNVAEWVLDDFDELGFDDLPRANPVRVSLPGTPAMTRGGSWRDPPFSARVDLPSYQSAFTLLRPLDPDTRAVNIGFRCVYGGATPEAAPPRKVTPVQP